MNRFAIVRQAAGMAPAKSVGILVYPGVEVLGVVGPTEVFAFANKALQEERLASGPAYECRLLARDEKPVSTLSGVQIVPTQSYRNLVGTLHTLIVPGGDNPDQAIADAELVRWIATRARKVQRLASVCTGAFLLAKSGLLDGRHVTTHWRYSDRFREAYPMVGFEPDRVLMRDGSLWSSGGVTSGIDLALAMVEEDWGEKLALHIARFLAVFIKRTAGHTQLSPYLQTEAKNRLDFRELQSWITENPAVDLRVKALAMRVEMSPRNFARAFVRETGVTPAKFVERVRIDLARHYLEHTELQVNVIAQQSGFRDAETLRRTFVRHTGVNPVDFRARSVSRSRGGPAEL